jgi:hypothetical protein
MTTAAQKLEGVAYEAKCIIKTGRKEAKGSAALGRLVSDGLDIKREIDLLQGRLDLINAEIVAKTGQFFDDGLGTVHVHVGAIDCKITKRDIVAITDGEALRGVLKKRFDDLVRTKITYAPERRLIEMATDADDLKGRRAAAYLAIKPAKPAVVYSIK